MKIIVCTLNEDYYMCRTSNEDNSWILAGFLMSDVGWCSASSFKDFINDPNFMETGGNYSLLEKEGDDVLIGCVFDKDAFEPCIRMKQKELLSILDQWEELINLRPKEIIIFKRGESYVLEGRDFPGE